jgi:hypothetical protein
MLTADDTWPPELVIPGLIGAVAVSVFGIVGIHAQIGLLLTFTWTIHSRLYPSFLDEGDRSKNETPLPKGPHASKPLDYPSRTLWVALELLGGSTLTYQAGINAWDKASGTDADRYIQALLMGIASFIGLSFTISNIWQAISRITRSTNNAKSK